jgi:pimeloyl-ACP methyl ester carboxylesterase
LPLLVVLHGGPGVPNRHGFFALHALLTTAFLVVTYDQRGAGGSYFHTPKDSLRLEVYLQDLHELVAYLKERFAQKKVYLLGGSWGTELGTLYAFYFPEDVAAYVGYGQVVNGHLNEDLSYEFTLDEAKKRKDRRALKTLAKIGPPVDGIYRPVYRGLMKQRALLRKYGGHSLAKEPFFRSFVKPVLFSGEYSLKDIVGYLRGVRFSLQNAWPHIVHYDFARDVHKFQVPIYIFQGTLDQNTPSALIQSYFDKIEAPKKLLLWFAASSHSPLSEEPEKFHEALLRYVLKGESPQ